MSELVKALAKVQSRLPDIRKGESAEVEGTTKSGKPFRYSYKYADLAGISKAVLPLLGENGLAWVTRPTFEGERFVLAYELRHVSGESVTGLYPLPERGSPQEIGSAITYARRYTLCSVTGVAPETDDDDGAAATRQHQDEWEAAKPATSGQAKVFDDFMAEIGAAPTRAAIAEIGKRVHMAKVKRDITPAQYDHLDVKAGARNAELDQEAAAAPEGAP